MAQKLGAITLKTNILEHRPVEDKPQYFPLTSSICLTPGETISLSFHLNPSRLKFEFSDAGEQKFHPEKQEAAKSEEVSMKAFLIIYLMQV